MDTPRITGMPGRKSNPFGLFAVIESKRVILPLKGVECDFSIVSGISEVSITQIFRQDNEKPIDCDYLFPLPADASVYSCEADINGRTIRAEVRERLEARRIATEKKAAGFRAALVEAERENLFTLSLGNVQPGDLVIIQLKYFQTIRSLAGMPSIEIPFCPGIRYIPGTPLLRSNKGKGIVDDTDEVPDASRISTVRIDADHPDAAFVEVRGTLDGKFVNENDLSSPSHQMQVQRIGDELKVSLSEKGEVPDRDFVLRWREKNAETVASRAWICEQDKQTYALLEIRAPKAPISERAPGDFYFLVDRSGSMEGKKWDKAAQALQACMKVLGPADRAMVTFFESSFKDFAERPLSVHELLSDRQFQNVKELGTTGGTELRPALKHILEVAGRHSTNRHKNLILITDAQMGNEPAILELMKSAPNFPVHCFGIDIALNDALLLALSRQQGGTFHSMNPNDDIEKAVSELGKTIGQPVLLDLTLPDGWETADAATPNLYAGQIHYLSAQCSNGSGERPMLHARSSSSRPLTIQFEQQSIGSRAPYLHWSRARIHRLIAEGRHEDAVELSIRSNLICPLTAFIAWDESEKVAIANHEVVQPTLGLFDDDSFGGGRLIAGMPKILGRAKFRRAPRKSLEYRLVGSVMPDELQLTRELSEICHRTGVADWQTLAKAIFDWIAEARWWGRKRKIKELNRLVTAVKSKATLFDRCQAEHDSKGMDKAREEIQLLLKTFVEQLPVR